MTGFSRKPSGTPWSYQPKAVPLYMQYGVLDLQRKAEASVSNTKKSVCKLSAQAWRGKERGTEKHLTPRGSVKNEHQILQLNITFFEIVSKM